MSRFARLQLLLLALVLVLVLATAGCCCTNPGSREFIPGKGWTPN